MPNRFQFALLPIVFLSLSSIQHLNADEPADYPKNSLQRLQEKASEAEQDGRWNEALDCYLKLHFANPTDQNRQKVRLCLRNSAQFRRHRDPSFQQFVISLPTSEAVAVYAEALEKLHGYYHERDRAEPGILFASGLDELEQALEDNAFRSRFAPKTGDTKLLKFRQSLQTDWRVRLPSNVKEAREAARELALTARFDYGITNPSAVVLELLCGACNRLDEHSHYRSRSAKRDDPNTLRKVLGHYGISAEAGAEGGIVINDIEPLSWASIHTNLQAGNKIVRWNGLDMAENDEAHLAEAADAVGLFGHELELDGKGLMTEPPAVRLPDPMPSVWVGELANGKGDIAYVRIANFHRNTVQELDDAITELIDQGMRAAIIDLRGNPGGLLISAVETARRFLPTGIIVTTQGQIPEFAGRVFSSDAGMSAWDFPVVLLVDSKTMSSAEVFAAALKENDRAILVGTPTFGKGLLQHNVRLAGAEKTPAGLLVISVASLYGPRGGPLNGTGVVPDVIEPDPIRQLQQGVIKATEQTQP